MNRTELGHRAVACKHWRWMDGMAANELPGYRVVSNNCEGRAYLTDGHDSQSVKDCSPDLSDPATIGCLLNLVREAYKSHFGPMRVSTQTNIRGEWYCNPNSGGPKNTWHATEAEALVAALEAAP
jgi:hypothetical protein